MNNRENNKRNETETKANVCMQCGKHCPLSNPGCERGANAEGITGKENIMKDTREENTYNKSEKYSHGEHGHGEHGHGEYGHGEHGHGEYGHGEHGHGEHSHGEGRQRGSRSEGKGHGKWDAVPVEEFRHENQEDIGYLLAMCAARYNRKGGTANTQKRILHMLQKKEELAQSALQEILDIKPGSLSEILSKMENRGYIERKPDEGDRRKVLIRITEQGISHSQEMHEKFHGKDKFEVLEEAEKTELKRLLKKLLDMESEKEEAVRNDED